MAKAKHLLLYKNKIFMLCENVYSPENYGYFLEEHIVINQNESVLDLCTGSGFFAIMLAEKARKVVGVDITIDSVNCAKKNVIINDLDNIEIRQGNLFDAISENEKFDLIVAWPPLFPTPVTKHRDNWLGIATEGGEDGRKVLDEIILNASKYLNQNGRLQILHAWYANIPKSINMLNTLGFEASITAEKYFPLGQISYERSDHLASIGFPPINKDGELMQYHALVTANWTMRN